MQKGKSLANFLQETTTTDITRLLLSIAEGTKTLSHAVRNLGVLNLGFPDVCKVPTPVPVPTPFPNLAFSTTHIPSVLNVVIGGGLAENLLTTGTVSSGDEGGILMGLISQMIDGPDRPLLGSIKTMIGGIFATRLTTINTHNGLLPNTVGISITPAQFRVILLS